MTAYATPEDLGSKWANLSGPSRADVIDGLSEARVLIDAALTQAGMEPADVADDMLKLVSCRMVRRAFPADDAGVPIGVESVQASLGSFQQTLRWGGGRSGELLLYRNEKSMLGIVGRAFQIDMLPEEYQS